MRSEILDKLFTTKNFLLMKDSTWFYNDYIAQLKELKDREIESIELSDFVNTIKESKDFSILKSMIEGIQSDKLYESFIHGEMHNERVALFSYYISTQLGLSDKDLRLSLYAAMYHDLGRIDDSVDNYHGLRSAGKLNELNLDISDEDMEILKLIITCHCLADWKFDKIINQYNIKDIKRAKKLFNVLKDADGLDRTRLPNPTVKIDFLRNKISKSLILTSYNLMNFYITNKKELNQELLF